MTRVPCLALVVHILRLMCNYLFIASDLPLPPLPWEDDNPGVFILKSSECENVDCLTKPHVGQIGSHDGCGCPFAFELWDDPSDPPNDEEIQEWNRNRQDFRQLTAYLEQVITETCHVEIYSGRDYWLPPLSRREVALDTLKGERFVFKERELLIVTSQ